MYNQAQSVNLTVDEYLKLELESHTRHEYIAGQIYPITAGSQRLKIITGNLVTRFRTHLIGTDYRIFSSDMKVRIEQLDIFYYPDVSVTCNQQDRHRYFKSHPCLVVEVYSPLTERLYRNEKLINYRQIETLQEYVLIDESKIKMDIYRQNNQNKWFKETLTDSDNLYLSSVNLEMSLTDIYEDVKF